MVEYELGFGRRQVNITYDPDAKTAKIGDKVYRIETSKMGNRILVDLDGKTHTIELVQGRVIVNGEEQRFTLQKGRPQVLGGKKTDAGSKGAKVKPPMPGRIVGIDVKVGDHVKKGQGILTLEAMKMQNEITAPTEGIVKAINVKQGQTVDANAVLVEIE